MKSLEPKIYLPIFNMSGIKSSYKFGEINLNIFIANYNQTLDEAIKDITNSLSTTKIAKINFINSLGGVYNIQKNKKLWTLKRGD